MILSSNCMYCETAMIGDGKGRWWCPNAQCPANVGNPRPTVSSDGDHASARAFARAMLEQEHGPELLNLCRCYLSVAPAT